MISESRLRVIARRQGITAGLAEKNYVNSWVLSAVYGSDFGDDLLFKGGTALSKLYFPDAWRLSEDLDFTVDGRYSGSESALREALDAVTGPSGIQFWIDDYYEGTDDGYPTYYVEASIQYRAVFDQKNTTELNVMGDEVVSTPPVDHTHEYEDVEPFTLRAYSLAEILGEKLRTIYQRSRGRDYYDVYRIVSGEETPPAATVAKIFEEKRAHAPEESYHTEPAPDRGLPRGSREAIASDWETTVPTLMRDVPELEVVWRELDTYLTETVAPALRE